MTYAGYYCTHLEDLGDEVGVFMVTAYGMP